MQIIGDNIKSELKEANMTQRELSEYSRIDRATVNKYVNGELMPTIINLNNMAVALCCRPEDLLTFDGDIIEKYKKG